MVTFAEMIIVCFIVVLYTALVSQAQLSPSKAVKSCSLSTDGEYGLCVPLTECPEVWQNFKKRNETVFCGIEGQVPLVCCASKTIDLTALALSYDSHSTGASQLNIPVSQRKCQEYSKLVYEGDDSKVEKCFIRPDGRKEGRAFLGEFPHMASLQYDGKYSENDIHECGGSLISERFVLTTAHCLVQFEHKRLMWVLLGVVDLTNTSTGQLIPIVQTIVHPDYRRGVHYFDIGLIRLKRAPILGPNLRPACLPSDDEVFTSRKLIVTGWGTTSFYDSNNSNDLLKTTVIETPPQVCSRYFRRDKKLRFGIHTQSMLCDTPSHKNSGACKGDSGGPVQVISTNHHCMYEIAGIISFGKGCGLKDVPEVNQRVQYYRRWIENIVWP